MDLVRDQQTVARLAREREDENWEFRSLLKSIHLSSEEIDAIVHRHYEEISRQIDCCACGNCCVVVSPILSRSDAERLACGLGMSLAELIDRYLVRADEENGFKFRTKPCPFLADKRCSVYDFRPENCRSFPHLHKDDFVFRLITVVENCSICPIVFNVYERLKDELRHDADDDRDGHMDCGDLAEPPSE